MDNLGDIFDELIKRWKSGESVRAIISNRILPDFIALLKREGVGIAFDSLNRVQNPHHRELLNTLLSSTLAFSIGGAVIGNFVAGPIGAAAGAASGAALGFAAGLLIITVSPSPDGDGVAFTLA